MFSSLFSLLLFKTYYEGLCTMLLSLVKRNTVKSKNLFALRFASAEEIKNYKNDSKNLAKWLDVSTVSRHGREFDAYTHLQDLSKADTFPNAQVLTLESKSITIPTAIDAKAKLICVSFKHYGFTLLRSWINPFIAKYNPSAVVQKDQDGYIDTAAVTTTPGGLSNPTGAIAYEICFVEFGFLSMAKSLFASNIRGTVDPSQVNRTGMIFGGAKVCVSFLFEHWLVTISVMYMFYLNLMHLYF